MQTIKIRRGAGSTATYRIVASDVIARERAKLGLPVASQLRAWLGPQEALVIAASDSEAWKKALALFPPTEGYRVESVRLANPDISGAAKA
ncbi:MAG: hypothetical protein IT564_06820 [Rhodospirillales bacterium]|nr:hypothetical protein [Rhodospirillales bacterium]